MIINNISIYIIALLSSFIIGYFFYSCYNDCAKVKENGGIVNLRTLVICLLFNLSVTISGAVIMFGTIAIFLGVSPIFSIISNNMMGIFMLTPFCTMYCFLEQKRKKRKKMDN